eukprot:CAMPEP_0118884188 /NCGR_PEP_ID=MMETSP1163-20130328/23093_1 /TAXON_ID=124430 /ORGANISM="Phaeomonas parva, Strain CCMP2877" /LENGTH=70 /DNA_ID=CAMNT_0006821875 /DNA_START=45 /DNA_END=254 /DNA_ORIENTATION=+
MGCWGWGLGLICSDGEEKGEKGTRQYCPRRNHACCLRNPRVNPAMETYRQRAACLGGGDGATRALRVRRR